MPAGTPLARSGTKFGVTVRAPGVGAAVKMLTVMVTGDPPPVAGVMVTVPVKISPGWATPSAVELAVTLKVVPQL